MILDILENAQHYIVINKRFPKANVFLLRPDLTELPVGKYEIDGERIFALVSKSVGRKREDARLETHDKYIDIQLILSGTDDMGWKPKSLCKQPSGDYDPKNDIQFFSDQPDTWITTQRGAFVIFFNDDAHMPLISSGEIHKVVVKVAVAAT